MKKIIFLLIIVFFVCSSFSQNIFKGKPYSLKKDARTGKKFRKENVNFHPSDSLVNTIITGLNDKNEKIREINLMKAAKNYDKKIIPVVENLLINDPSPLVRKACPGVLGTYRSSKSIPVLIKALNDTNIQVRKSVTYTLAFLGEKENSFISIMKLYNEVQKDQTKVSLLGQLVYINTKEAVNFLKKEINNSNPCISVTAAHSLAKLKYYKIAFPVLKEFLNYNSGDRFLNAYVPSTALWGLAYIGDKASIELIKSMLNDNKLRNTCKWILKQYGIEVTDEK